jgi:hypothetical protein
VVLAVDPVIRILAVAEVLPNVLPFPEDPIVYAALPYVSMQTNELLPVDVVVMFAKVFDRILTVPVTELNSIPVN